MEKKLVLCWALLKSVSVVGFQSQMLDATNFWLVLGDCIVIAMIFIKKPVVKKSSLGFFINCTRSPLS